MRIERVEPHPGDTTRLLNIAVEILKEAKGNWAEAHHRIEQRVSGDFALRRLAILLGCDAALDYAIGKSAEEARR